MAAIVTRKTVVLLLRAPASAALRTSSLCGRRNETFKLRNRFCLNIGLGERFTNHRTSSYGLMRSSFLTQDTYRAADTVVEEAIIVIARERSFRGRCRGRRPRVLGCKGNFTMSSVERKSQFVTGDMYQKGFRRVV